MLKVITEGLKAAPVMNSHIKFNKKLVRGKIMTFEDINISMPMLLPDGSMMTVNLHNFEDKNIWEMSDYIADIRRKIKNTDLNEVMVDVSMANTFDGLRKGKLKQTAYRIIGSKTGRHRIHSLNGKKEDKVGKVMPICIAFDHRALDFGDIVPFLKRLDELFENPRCLSR